MDSFTYTNIFDTKGIEYIVVLAFFAILIPFWIVLNRQVKITRNIQRTLGLLTSNRLIIPQGLLYSKNQTWSFLKKSGNAKIGISDLLQKIIGEVEMNYLKKTGDNIKRGEPILSFVQNGKTLQINSPITGKILKTNDALHENPALLNLDPYNKGWLLEIKPENWIHDIHSYHTGEETIKWEVDELNRFKDFLAKSTQKYHAEESLTILQDGGEIRENVLTELPNDIWKDFQTEFLD